MFFLWKSNAQNDQLVIVVYIGRLLLQKKAYKITFSFHHFEEKCIILPYTCRHGTCLDWISYLYSTIMTHINVSRRSEVLWLHIWIVVPESQLCIWWSVQMKKSWRSLSSVPGWLVGGGSTRCRFNLEQKYSCCTMLYDVRTRAQEMHWTVKNVI